MNSPFKRPDIDLTGMASMTAAVVAREFLLISRFIPPPQFVLELWSAMADSLGIKVHQTTAYHPQTNGMCKQLHESLKAALWGSLTGLRCAVREDLWDSPAELVLGQPLRDPGEFMPASPPPPFVFQYLYAVSPFHQRLVFHSWCTTACPTLLFCLTARSGLFNQAESLSFLDFGSRQEVVPIDRLKPAHVLHDQVVPAQALFCSCPPTTGLTDFGFSCRSAPHPAQLELSAAFPDHQCQPCPQASLKQKNS